MSEGTVSAADMIPVLGQQVLICAKEATVYRDLHKPAPYPLTGDVVGRVESVDTEVVRLAGWTFAIEVRLDDVRAWWLRPDAPDPCPICGGTG